jgi:hypothetical protein
MVWGLDSFIGFGYLFSVFWGCFCLQNLLKACSCNLFFSKYSFFCFFMRMGVAQVVPSHLWLCCLLLFCFGLFPAAVAVGKVRLFLASQHGAMLAWVGREQKTILPTSILSDVIIRNYL